MIRSLIRFVLSVAFAAILHAPRTSHADCALAACDPLFNTGKTSTHPWGFWAPWSAGDTWNAAGTCGGSWMCKDTHAPGTLQYGVDFNKIELPNTCKDEKGDAIRATVDGRVWNASLGWNGGYGNMIDLLHNVDIDGDDANEEVITRYTHLSAFGAGIAAGVEVVRGQAIGFAGSTGKSTGTHLHFELRDFTAQDDGVAEGKVGYTTPFAYLNSQCVAKNAYISSANAPLLYHPAGSVIRQVNDPKVYLRVGTTGIRHFVDEQAFYSWRYKPDFSEVRLVSPEEMGCYQKQDELLPVTLEIAEVEDLKVYLVRKDNVFSQQRWFIGWTTLNLWRKIARSWGFPEYDGPDLKTPPKKPNYANIAVAGVSTVRDGTVHSHSHNPHLDPWGNSQSDTGGRWRARILENGHLDAYGTLSRERNPSASCSRMGL